MEKADTTSRIRQITWVGIWVNLVLCVAKIFAGILGSSRALVADGIESGTDIVTSIALLVGAKFWNAPPDKEHPYGHRRIETVITLGIGLVVGGVGVSIIFNGVTALHNGVHSHPTLLAFVVAVVSVLAKELLFQWSAHEGRKIKSMAVVANAWHHRSDAFSSIPVMVSVGVAQFMPNWGFLDALGALVAAGFILKASVKILWPAVRQIADFGAGEDSVRQIGEIALSVDGVRSIHDVRTRQVGSSLQVDLHIVVDPDITVMAGHVIADHVTERLKTEGPEILDVLVHLDPSPDM
ncbi:MAG TPA: cation diffusion facilitator family transporter [Fibrobacteraceae bacterium]|nr:cation diffusion facilitator family transporter [Fibrobacteraceae bacterium]